MRITIDNSILTDIADSIREKGGASGLLAPQAMAEAIQAISGGGSDLPFKVTYGDLFFYTETPFLNYNIYHNLNEKPVLFFIWKNDLADYQGNANQKLRNAFITNEGYESVNIRRWSNEQNYCTGFNKGWITSDSEKVTFLNTDSYFAPNLKYSWVAIGGMAE